LTEIVIDSVVGPVGIVRGEDQVNIFVEDESQLFPLWSVQAM
jgi:uncharacterized protein YjfI (DUF2170 family)